MNVLPSPTKSALKAPHMALSHADLSRLMPMHLMISSSGAIISMGPTVPKLGLDGDLTGKGFFDLFDITRPRNITQYQDLANSDGGRLKLRLRQAPHLPMTAIAVPNGNGDGLLLNLSFGFSVVDAVQTFDLTCGDFAATDLTVEMLFLLEAKSAAQTEQKRLNERLQSA